VQVVKARAAAVNTQRAPAAFSVERVLVDATTRRQLFSALEKAGLKAESG
jgi:hypothetical protein